MAVWHGQPLSAGRSSRRSPCARRRASSHGRGSVRGHGLWCRTAPNGMRPWMLHGGSFERFPASVRACAAGIAGLAGAVGSRQTGQALTPGWRSGTDPPGPLGGRPPVSGTRVGRRPAAGPRHARSGALGPHTSPPPHGALGARAVSQAPPPWGSTVPQRPPPEGGAVAPPPGGSCRRRRGATRGGAPRPRPGAPPCAGAVRLPHCLSGRVPREGVDVGVDDVGCAGAPLSWRWSTARAGLGAVSWGATEARGGRGAPGAGVRWTARGSTEEARPQSSSGVPQTDACGRGSEGAWGWVKRDLQATCWGAASPNNAVEPTAPMVALWHAGAVQGAAAHRRR